jgi:oligopeptide/dipeptide ABC transporter ATP-binding protein
LAAVPVPRPAARQAIVPLDGEIPSPADPPRGCHFHTRCPYAEARCRAEAPVLRDIAPGHQVACHLAPAAA